MKFALDPAHYEGVPVCFWAYVFLQLLWLDHFHQTTGRGFMGYVCIRSGRVIIEYVADEPDALAGWQADPARLPWKRELPASISEFAFDPLVGDALMLARLCQRWVMAAPAAVWSLPAASSARPSALDPAPP